VTIQSREIRLKARPTGELTPDLFELTERAVAPPDDGEVRVRNLFMSVDPYMRGRMNDVESYTPPFALGEVLQGAAIGRVLESRAPGLAAGDLVTSNLGWREAFTAPPATLARVAASKVPPSYHLGVLGMPGLTAYVGVLDIAAMRAGETLFVSGAAGAVGSIAGQIARVTGCRVIGSAGSDDKVRWLVDDLGFDAAFNYRDVDLEAALSEHAPDGLDGYFDNVGYEHLQAAINHMNDFGRIAACGSIAGYNAATPGPGPNNLAFVVRKRLMIRGFLVGDHGDWRAPFAADMGRWLAQGSVRTRETVLEGIERAPEAFIGLFDGANIGKMLVRLAHED